MPDVGILNLQIHDDSAKAAEGLNKLVAKLKEMKEATSGIKLGTVATGIKRINDELNKVQPSAIYKLKQLADVLGKIGSVSGNVGGIRISFGGRGQSVEDMAAQMQAARDAVAQTTSNLESVGRQIQEDIHGAEGLAGAMGRVNEIVQQTGWTAQATAEQFAQLFQVWNSMRMSMSIGGSESPLALGDGTGGSGAGWTYWKDGAIEVEGTVTDAMESIRIGAGETIPLLTGIVDESYEIAGSFREITEGSESFAASMYDAAALAKAYGVNMETVERAIQESATSGMDVGSIITNWNMAAKYSADSIEGVSRSIQDTADAAVRAKGVDVVDYLVKNGDAAMLLKMRIDSLRESLAAKIDDGASGDQVARSIQQIQKLEGELRALNGTAEETKKSFSEIMIGSNGLSGAFKRMFPTVSGLLSRFRNLVKYRMLRAVIRQIAEGFREGKENYYQYSKSIGSSFAPAMDSASAALLQMKNSIGAAAAPIIQSLIPVLKTVVSWFVTAVNFANQFFSLITGQKTWSRAILTDAEAFEDSTKSTAGSVKEMKNLLADFDELNVIQSASGGGGGGGVGQTTKEYQNMFEEVGKFDERIRGLVEGINEQFGDIWGLVTRIATAMLGWKVSSAFAGILGTIGGLVAAGAIIDIVFNITQLLDNQYFKTGDIGWVVADVLQSALGAFLAGKVVGKVLGTGAARVTAGVTLAVSAVADIIALVGAKDVTALSEKGIITEIKSGLKLGAGFFLLEKFAGVATGKALIAAGEAAAIGIGVAIGIKAIATYADTGELSLERIKELLIGAGIAGAGVTLFELAAGAGAAAALTAGGVVALATGLAFAAAVGVVALLNVVKNNGIQWGTEKLTSEQIEAFVTQEMFVINVPVTIKVLGEKTGVIVSKREAIETQLANALGTFEVIRLGVASDQDYAQLRTDILGDESTGAKGLIGTIEDYVAEAKAAGKLTLAFTPKLVGGTEDEQGQWFGSYTSGWEMVNEYARRKGKIIGEMLVKGENEAIVDGETVTIATLMQQLQNVTTAITRGRINSEAYGRFMFNLGDISQASFEDMVSAFTTYKDDLRAKYQQWVNEQYTLQGELVAALLEIDPGMVNKETKAAVASYKYMGEHMAEAVNDEVERAAAPAVEMMTEFLANKYDGVAEFLSSKWRNVKDMSGVFNPLVFTGFDVTELRGMNAKQAAGYLREQFASAIEGEFNADLGRYIKGLGLNPFDFFFSDLDTTNQNALLDYIRNLFDPETAEEVIRYLIPDYDQGVELPVTVEPVVEDTDVGAGIPDDLISSLVGGIGTSDSGIDLDLEYDIDQSATEPVAVPAMDISAFADSLFSMEDATRRAVLNIQSMLSGLSYYTSMIQVSTRNPATMESLYRGLQHRASGGPVRSGDLVVANENGQFEMMGRMGNQPVVANNQQIVSGITRGVEQGQAEQNALLRVQNDYLRRLLEKNSVVEVRPSAEFGRFNERSAELWAKQSGR